MNSYEWHQVQRESRQEAQARVYFGRGFWWGVFTAYFSALVGLIVGLNV